MIYQLSHVSDMTQLIDHHRYNMASIKVEHYLDSDHVINSYAQP